MKRVLAGILTAVLVLGMGTMDVSAAGGRCGSHHSGSCSTGSSVCVSTERAGACGKAAAGQGVCSRKNVCCSSYVDADGDGICDSCDGACKVYKNNRTVRRSGCGRRCHR